MFGVGTLRRKESFACRQGVQPDRGHLRAITLSLCSHAPRIPQFLSSDCGHQERPGLGQRRAGARSFRCASCQAACIFRHAEDFHPIQKSSASLYPDWLLFLPARRVYPVGAPPAVCLEPRSTPELSRPFEKKGATLWPKRGPDSRIDLFQHSQNISR